MAMTTITDYGGGPSTGLEQTVAGRIVTGFARDDLCMTADGQSRAAAAGRTGRRHRRRPAMAETRRLWTKINRLEKTRPAVFCDPENGWNEIITEAQMQCRGKLARRWEMDLRKEIFWGEVMGDDKPVDPYFLVPYTAARRRLGTPAGYQKGAGDGSYRLGGAIKDYATDLKKMHSPPVQIDWETTNGCLDIAKDVLGDLLPVRPNGVWWWSLGLTWPAATFRGLQNMLCDFIEHPDELKELLSILSRGHLEKLDYLEAHQSAQPEQRRHLRRLGRIRLQRRIAAAGFHRAASAPGDMWGFSREPRDGERLARRCTSSSSSPTRSRSWSGSA